MNVSDKYMYVIAYLHLNLCWLHKNTIIYRKSKTCSLKISLLFVCCVNDIVQNWFLMFSSSHFVCTSTSIK